MKKELEKEVYECRIEDICPNRTIPENRSNTDNIVHYDAIKLNPLMSLTYYKVLI